MWIISGTIPDDDFQLSTSALWEDSTVNGDILVLPDGRTLKIGRGTTALAATAIVACNALNVPVPRLLLAADSGKGNGSAIAYTWLSKNLAMLQEKLAPFNGLTFHYFYPDLDGHNRVFMAVEALSPRPVLVADAGFMYVAKMSGYATEYDLFTPDLGELAFLADEKAPHPFYTRGFLLAEESDIPALIERALKNDNCPQNMIIKGQTDYIFCNGKITAKVSEPSVPAMEAIGGTGDIVTGLATAWLCAGTPICNSALWAARTARLLAEYCNPDPSTQASDLIAKLGELIENRKADIQKGSDIPE